MSDTRYGRKVVAVAAEDSVINGNANVEDSCVMDDDTAESSEEPNQPG